MYTLKVAGLRYKEKCR